MSLADISTTALRRTAAPADVIDYLQVRVEILEALVRELTGGDLVRDLVDLFPSLTPSMALILATLLTRTIAGRDALIASVYGLKEQPVEEHTIVVHLSKLRRRLPDDIIIHNKRGLGWSLDADSKARITAALAARRPMAAYGNSERNGAKHPNADRRSLRRAAGPIEG